MKEATHWSPTNIKALLHKIWSPRRPAPMICALLLLLKTIFNHNSMHFMLQAQRTETMRRWSASDNRF